MTSLNLIQREEANTLSYYRHERLSNKNKDKGAVFKIILKKKKQTNLSSQ